VRFFFLHLVAEDSLQAAGSLFPMAPGELALRGVEKNDAQDWAEFSRGSVSMRGRRLDLLAWSSTSCPSRYSTVALEVPTWCSGS